MPPIPPQNSNSNNHSEEDAEISLTDEDESNSPVVHPQKQHLITKQPHEKSSHPSGSTTSNNNGGLSFSSTMILVVVATVAYSMHGVLTELCKRSNDGKLPFNTSALVMLSEVIKLVVSFSLLYVSQVRDPSHSLPDGADSHHHIKPSQQDGMVALLRSLIFPIDWGMVAPALIYGINNPISFIALNYMDAATFQALSNLKIITTTLLSWIVFRKSFTPVHWTSITLLFLGCLLTTESSNAGGDANSETLGASFFGLILMIVSAVFSALAGVAFEFYAKKQKNESLHAQNFRLYLYGIVFNVIGMIAQFIYSGGSSSSSGQSQEWFIQFTFWTICVLLNQSFAGLLLSAIMRYADNIVRLYCIAAATILSTLFAVLVLGMTLHKLWIYAALLIGMSIYLYNVTLFHSSLNVSFTSSESEHHEENKVVFFNLTRSDLSKIVKSIAVVTAITFIVVYSNKF